MNSNYFNSEEELVRSISRAEKVFRRLAIEETARFGASKELFNALKKQQGVESDEENRILLSAAIKCVQERLNTGLKTKTEVTGESFTECFINRSSDDRLELLASIQSSFAQSHYQAAANFLEQEENPLVASELIKKFAEYFSEEQTPVLSKLLFSHYITVRSAALEALIAKKPELLVEYLPKLLVSEDPRIRVLAVRGLAKIDPVEASLHLESMLLEGDPTNRAMALQNCLLLPFDLVKSPLLQYCAGENDVSLLARVGLVFKINPDPEVPYRLFEILESSSGAKVETLKKIVDGACKVIKASRILRDDYQEYLAKLQTWVNKRVLRRKVYGYLNKLQDPEIEQTPLEETILADLAKPEIRSAFEEALEWQIPSNLKARVNDILNNKIQKEPPPTTPKVSNESFDQIPNEEKIRFLSCLEHGENKNVTILLGRILNDQNSPDNMRSTALRTALRLEIGDFTDLAGKWLSSSSDALIGPALEYLANFNFDQVIPVLGIHLKSSNQRLRIIALNILRKTDPSQAVSTLMAILRSSDFRTRKLAMNCLIQFDFSLIREPFVEFLLSSRGKRFIQESLYIFQANPDPENLYYLYRIEKNLGPEESKAAKAARLHCAEILIKSARLTPEEAEAREKEITRRFSQEEEKRKAPPPYALSKLRKQPESGAGAFENFWQSIIDDKTKLPFLISKVAIILFGIFYPMYYFFFMVSEPQRGYKGSQGGYSPLHNQQSSRLFQNWNKNTNNSQNISGNSFFQSSRNPVEAELEVAAEIVRKSAAEPSNIPGISTKANLMLQANQNPLVGEALAAAQSGDLSNAETLLLDALNSDSGNPFLEIIVYGELCNIYQKLGKQKEYEEAFRKYLLAVQRLPENIGASMTESISNFKSLIETLEKNIDKLEIKPNALNPNDLKSLHLDAFNVQKNLKDALEVVPSSPSEKEGG